MNRVCLTKSGKLIEMQSGGDDRLDLMEMRLDTLKQNALSRGYSGDNIEVKWVTEEEWAVIWEAQQTYEAENESYSVKRAREYSSLSEQLDMIYWDKVNGTSKWQEHIKAVKDKYPKK